MSAFDTRARCRSSAASFSARIAFLAGGGALSDNKEWVRPGLTTLGVGAATTTVGAVLLATSTTRVRVSPAARMTTGSASADASLGAARDRNAENSEGKGVPHGARSEQLMRLFFTGADRAIRPESPSPTHVDYRWCARTFTTAA